MMHSTKQLIVLLALIQFSFLNAWIQHQNNGRRQMFNLASSSSSGSEDLNFQRQRKQLESVFKKDKVDYESDETLHIGGLFESLSVLPVYDWAETEFDLVGCRDDECDQCEIPEEFKGHYPEVDVLAFLGIQRAEPLRVPKKP